MEVSRSAPESAAASAQVPRPAAVGVADVRRAQFEPQWSPRPSWTEAPASLVTWAESMLGGPIMTFRDVVGGFSSGLATRLAGPSGRRLFVKAVNPELNSFAAAALHRERAVGHALSPVPRLAVPRLRGAFDDGRWLGLAFDEVDGTNPSWPWTEADLARTLDALAELHRALTPAPDVGLPAADQAMQRHRGRWASLAGDCAAVAALDPWLRVNLDRLAARAVQADLAGDTLINVDVRADNVVFDGTGRVWFVDWPWACVGAAHVDVMFFLVNAAVCGHDPEQWLARSHVADAPPEDCTDALCLLAGMLAEGSGQPEPPGVRGLRPFQSAHLDAATDWLRRRLG
ncbi:MAG: hypothetical protein ABJA87_10760 [bacterium]